MGYEWDPGNRCGNMGKMWCMRSLRRASSTSSNWLGPRGGIPIAAARHEEHISGVALHTLERVVGSCSARLERVTSAWRMPFNTLERVTPASMDCLLANPPYWFEDGRRAEYRIIADAGAALRPGGILVAILPARSAWDGTMINHWAKHYEQVCCWSSPMVTPILMRAHSRNIRRTGRFPQ